MEPIACSEIDCIRKMCAGAFTAAAKCRGSRCSQWVPVAHGSPPVQNVGYCADNGKRLMRDGGAA